MCGICGIIGLSDPESSSSTLSRMTKALHHRGPDGDGAWISAQPPVAFGHKRLAIIDLSEKAAQPFISADNRYVITYNGEVYNYRELREECVRLGSVFTSQSDTEVILECYRHWGIRAFTRFRGMWAFVMYDADRSQAVFCRDPFGIKPLYYGIRNDAVFFASEPKALRKADESFSTVDESTVFLFERYGYIDRGDWTFFKNISRFPQAHYAVVELDGKSPRIDPIPYWSPPHEPLKIGVEEAADELQRLLLRSVELHLRSDVPVGSCLSGGIDSSAIVCIGSALASENGRFNTFTTSYPDEREIDETAWAEKVIERTRALPHYASPTLESFVSDLDKLIHSQDEPFGSTSIYAQYSVFKRISGTPVKVILDGQGADEVFAGYHGLLEVYLNYLLGRGSVFTFMKESVEAARLYDQRISSHWNNALNFTKGRLKAHLKSVFTNPARHGATLLDEVEQRMGSLTMTPPSFEQYLVEMVMSTNLPQLLRYEDRNSMAFSIESRVPFLDTELVGFALALPAGYKIRRGTTKYILREALKGIIPEEIRTRVDKLGFPAPERTWLKKGFGIDIDTAGSPQWRRMVVTRWRAMLNDPRPC